MIKTLFVDIGGVLLTNGWDHNSREAAAKKFRLDAKEMESRHRLTFDIYEIGKISLEEYLQRVVFNEKRTFSQKQFKDFMFAQSKPYPEMIQLIQEIKDVYKVKVIAVSNEGRELNEYRIKKFKLDQLIDFFVSSSFVHLRKPDTDILHLALDLSQTAPQNVVYIDDRLLFVEIGVSLGIHGLHHQDEGSTRKKLNKEFDTKEQYVQDRFQID